MKDISIRRIRRQRKYNRSMRKKSGEDAWDYMIRLAEEIFRRIEDVKTSQLDGDSLIESVRFESRAVNESESSDSDAAIEK